MAATKRALWGALEAGLTDACRAGSQHLVDMWGHPDQTEGPLSFTEKRPADWLPLRTRSGVSYEHLKVERHGPVGWLINNRPDQLNAMNAQDARRVRRCVARARPRTPRCG